MIYLLIQILDINSFIPNIVVYNKRTNEQTVDCLFYLNVFNNIVFDCVKLHKYAKQILYFVVIIIIKTRDYYYYYDLLWP